MLALCSSCAPTGLTLAAAVASLADHRVGAVALHRAPSGDEQQELARQKERPRIVAVYGVVKRMDLGRPLVVVEGGPVGPDPEASLLELCRTLHALRDHDVALRTPAEAGHHPAPREIELVRGELPRVGYFHDVARADSQGGDYLDAASRCLFGASFHPLLLDDLGALRDALPAAAPAVVECPVGELAEAVRRARGVFRA